MQMLTPMATLLLEVRLNEMAKMVTADDRFVSKLTDNPKDINPKFYDAYKVLPVLHDFGNNIHLHASVSATGNAYFATLNHNNGRAIHITKVISKKKSAEFPHDHLEQELVDKDSNHPIGQQPGYARNFAYNHWETQHRPFRSSSSQAVGGHKMWKKYATQALNDGKHVYFHDEADGKFVPIDHENLDHYHQHYFGDQEHHKYRSLVLSHTPLK